MSEITKTGYILPQGNGFMVVGMGESLAKTFSNRDAAVRYALSKGLTLTHQPTSPHREVEGR